MILKNGTVLDDDFKFRVHDLAYDGSGIKAETSADGEEIDCAGCYIVPGLIDVHTHGAMGFDSMDAQYEAVQTIARYHASTGVTSYMPTLITGGRQALLEALENIKAAKENGAGGADIIGINMEGPYFSPLKKGAHDERHLRAPDTEEFDEFYEASGGLVKMIGVAPELDGAIDFIRAEKDRVKIAVGHSDADYGQGTAAIDAGAVQLIHTFNAMRPFTHREPNLIGAAFDSNIFCEVISDGFHLAPSAVRLIYKAIGRERMVLITDSICAAGMPDGNYTLGGLAMIVKDGKAFMENGAIAGGSSTLLYCVKKAHEFGIPLEDAFMAATKNPAVAIDTFGTRGSITVGKRADLLILDKELNLKQVILNGKTII